MAVEIIVPRLGWSMDEGTFVEWLKADGDFVEQGDMIFVLEGDKAEQEVESFDAGFLHLPAGAPRPGETVVVGQRLAYLLAKDEAAPTDTPAVRPRAEQQAAAPSPVPSLQPPAEVDRPGHPAARIKATPRARRRARELGIEWSQVRGTGRHGRIRERDILAWADSYSASSGPRQLAAGTLQPASTVRRTIAQRMMAGVHQTAPVTLTTKVNAQGLVEFRLASRGEDAEHPLPSYTDILVWLVGKSLPECPTLNACWHQDGLYLYDEVNVAIAVETAKGLLAPVLSNVGTLSLEEIAAESRILVAQARAGRLAADQLENGTFTITNLGMFAIDFFTPIINLPQAAVLGVGRIADEPVVDDGQVVPGKTLSLSLTFDHRVIDGAPAARWLQQLGRQIEQIS